VRPGPAGSRPGHAAVQLDFSAGEAAFLALSAAAAVVFSAPAAGLALAAGFAFGFAAAGFGFASVVGADVVWVPTGLVDSAGLAGVSAFGFASAGVGFGFAAAFGFVAEAAGLAAAFGFVADVAVGVAAASADVAAAAVALDFAVADFAFGFGLAAAFGFGFAADFVAVADFGAFFAPAFGALFRAAGLRAVVPAARVRSVFVEPGVPAPVFVPPARVGFGAVSVSVTGASSSRPPETTLRTRPTTPVMMSLGVGAMRPL